MLYKIRHYCPKSVLRSLYFSLFNSHLSYGLVVWGNAKNSLISKIKSLQNRALRCIEFSNEAHDKINNIHHNLNVLSVDHQLQVQLSSLMWDYDHDTLPESLKTHFKRANLVHNYCTRSASKGSLFHGKVNTIKYGIQSFKYQGIKVLNGLKNMPFYQNSPNKTIFIKKLESQLLSSYTQQVFCQCMSIRQSVRFKFVRLSVFLSAYLSVYLPVNLSVCYVCLFCLCLSVYLSICLSACVYPFVSLSICPILLVFVKKDFKRFFLSYMLNND